MKTMEEADDPSVLDAVLTEDVAEQVVDSDLLDAGYFPHSFVQYHMSTQATGGSLQD
jgi:hypothetical protein